jgi:hypothetical protein
MSSIPEHWSAEANFRQPLNDPSFVIYEWLTSPAYLIRALVRDATVLTGAVDDDAGQILDQLAASTSCFAFHLNCTMTQRFPYSRDELVRGLLDRRVLPLNGGATDISKRAIQETCAELGLPTTRATRKGPPDETIIVKTNLNFGGASEWALSEGERRALGLGKGSDIIWKPDHYRILPRREIEDRWWTDESLICERYVENSEGLWYRCFVFLDRLAVCELASVEQIKKVGESEVRQTWMLTVSDGHREPPGSGTPLGLVSALVRYVRATDLDFGAIDVLTDEQDRPYIVDVNTTPAYNHPVTGVAEHLRGALSPG